MEESDLLKYFEGRVAEMNHRIESIESAMEKMLEIIQNHDELLVPV